MRNYPEQSLEEEEFELSGEVPAEVTIRSDSVRSSIWVYSVAKCPPERVANQPPRGCQNRLATACTVPPHDRNTPVPRLPKLGITGRGELGLALSPDPASQELERKVRRTPPA